MRKTLVTLMTLGILSGCGGEDETGASASAAPRIALTLPSSAESGSTIPVSVTVTDDKDSGLAFTLSCNAGTLAGTMLTLPVVAAAATVECTAAATDSDGLTTTVRTSVTVNPITAALIPYLGTEESVAAGGVGLLFSENLPLEQAQYQGTFNGRTIPLYRLNGNELAYVLPVDLAPGTGDITVQVGARVLRASITVAAAPAAADPRGRVRDFLQQAREDVVVAMAVAGITGQDRAKLEEALPRLDEALATMGNVSDAEISEFATRLAALGLLAGPSVARLSYDPIVFGPECGPNASKFGKSLAGLVLGGILLVEGTNSLIAGALVPGAGWGAAVLSGVAIGAGAVMVTKFGPQINPTRRAFWTSCWTELSVDLVPFSTDDFLSSARVSAITLPGVHGFRPGISRSFKLERAFAPAESVRARASQFQATVGKVLASVSILPADVKEALLAYKVDGSEAVPASRLSLANVSHAKVTGSATSNDEIVALVFRTSAKAEDLTQGKLPFTFDLLRASEQGARIGAEMILSLPEAFDAAVEVVQGQATASSVRTTGAETLHVTGAPAHGSVILSDSGEFQYRPSGTFFGRDQFKYIARNADGDSKEATVVVDVVRRFEGTWRVTISSRTTSETSPGLCPAERGTFTAGVSKISDTQYSTVYGGYELILRMSSQDDPAGLSGSRSYTDQDEDEKETGTVSISIPDSQTLRGSNSWTWSGPGNKSCSGVTTVTGTR